METASAQQAVEEYRRVKRGVTGEVGDLVTARGACCHDDGSYRLVANRRKQLALANRSRDLVVVPSVPKRSRHPAATGVEVDNGRARDSPKQRARRCDKAHRLLVAVAVQKDRRGPRLERKTRHQRGGELLEQHAD